MHSRSAILLRLSAAVLLCSCGGGARATAQQGDPPGDIPAIVRRALIENRNNLNALRSYIFVENAVLDSFDSKGRTAKSTTRREEIFFLDGLPYERLLETDGQPLSEAERAKQEQRIDRQMRETQSESAEKKAERQRKAAKALADEIAIRDDIVDGFVFTQVAEEQRDGDDCIKLEAEPRDDFKGKSSLRSVLPLLHGTIWIDVPNGQWVEIEAAPIEKVGRGVAYVKEDSVIHLRQSRIDATLWAVTSADIRLDARLLWDRKNVDSIKSYSNFRKFSTSVRILSPGDVNKLPNAPDQKPTDSNVPPPGPSPQPPPILF